ncbi:hypothetical protein [Nocardioides nitrophenolicus]|uniref:hypothetical protein n=1 Tax=Nocardioides nitrophenolicus TaxID=60489 RepID=UPI001956A67A|nr:hypothetical protein [Nocardioides nitrophenolicus]MBM7516771.1 hypothetical protein [Nocardioides nitrophenolicus]
MTLTADPAALRRAARQLDDDAGELRARRTRLVAPDAGALAQRQARFPTDDFAGDSADDFRRAPPGGPTGSTPSARASSGWPPACTGTPTGGPGRRRRCAPPPAWSTRRSSPTRW